MWVVALHGQTLGTTTVAYVPKGIANNKEGNILGLRIGEDGITGRFDHFTVRYNERSAIERLLLTDISETHGQWQKIRTNFS